MTEGIRTRTWTKYSDYNGNNFPSESLPSGSNSIKCALKSSLDGTKPCFSRLKNSGMNRLPGMFLRTIHKKNVSSSTSLRAMWPMRYSKWKTLFLKIKSSKGKMRQELEREKRKMRKNNVKALQLTMPEDFPKRLPVTHRKIPMFSQYNLSCGPLTICISSPGGFLDSSPPIRLF